MSSASVVFSQQNDNYEECPLSAGFATSAVPRNLVIIYQVAETVTNYNYYHLVIFLSFLPRVLPLFSYFECSTPTISLSPSPTLSLFLTLFFTISTALIFSLSLFPLVLFLLSLSLSLSLSPSPPPSLSLPLSLSLPPPPSLSLSLSFSLSLSLSLWRMNSTSLVSNSPQ